MDPLGDAELLADLLGLLEERALIELLGDLLAEADLLALADLVAEADLLAVDEVLGLAEWPGFFRFAAAVRTALFGTVEHAVVMMAPLLASTAKASLNVLKPMNMKPVSAPSAAGRRIRALTRAPRFSKFPRQTCNRPSRFSHYAWPT